METLIEQLHKLKDKLYLGEFKSDPLDKEEWDLEVIDSNVINTAVETGYETGFADALNAALESLQAILADYELREMRNVVS